MDTIQAIALILSVVGCSIAVLTLLFKISGQLSKIQDNTGKIDDVKTEVTKLSTSVDVVIRYGLQDRHSSVTVTLPHLGEVVISATPQADTTEYSLRFVRSHPVLDEGYIGKKSQELGFNKTEEAMLGKPAYLTNVGSSLMVLTVPSVDPKTCSEYVSALLKFIDSLVEGWDAELQKFENIKL
jgi:hypothetical protein